jgi:hypothetical protein
MSSHAAGLAGRSGPRARGGNSRTTLERLGRWERCAHWLAPLLTAGLLGACTFLMFAARGVAVI